MNLAVTLADNGVLGHYGVELIGAKLEAIKKAEDRDLFKQVMQEIGLALPRSGCIATMTEARQVMSVFCQPAGSISFPVIVFPARFQATRASPLFGARSSANWASAIERTGTS